MMLPEGTGDCESGDAMILAPGAAPSPDIAEVISEGDSIYESVTDVRQAALSPSPALATAGR